MSPVIQPLVTEACVGWGIIYPAKEDTRETKEQILNNNCAWYSAKGEPTPTGCSKENK